MMEPIPVWYMMANAFVNAGTFLVLIIFMVRLRIRDLARVDADSLKTLREIRDQFKLLEERLDYQMRHHVMVHEHEFHGRPNPQMPDFPPQEQGK
jgi:hypothetical protein